MELLLESLVCSINPPPHPHLNFVSLTCELILDLVIKLLFMDIFLRQKGCHFHLGSREEKSYTLVASLRVIVRCTHFIRSSRYGGCLALEDAGICQFALSLSL